MQGKRFTLSLVLLTLQCVALSVTGKEYPQDLNAWGIFTTSNDVLSFTSENVAYTLETPLFSDYALKLRSVKVPRNTKISLEGDKFSFPEGTILSKTFFYPKVDGEPWADDTKYREFSDVTSIILSRYELIETRLLVLEKNGWAPINYVWKDGSATRSRYGTIKKVGNKAVGSLFPYIAPTEKECASCHQTNVESDQIEPLGFQLKHLSQGKLGTIDDDQIQYLVKRGIIEKQGTLEVLPLKKSDHSARLYLDIHCSHCHNPHGHAHHVNLSFRYEASMLSMGVCKDPVKYRLSRDEKIIFPGSPMKSLIFQRLSTIDHSIRMPPLGRQLADQQGLKIIQEWILAMPSSCD